MGIQISKIALEILFCSARPSHLVNRYFSFVAIAYGVICIYLIRQELLEVYPAYACNAK